MSFFDGDRDHDDNDNPPFPIFRRESDHNDFNRRILLTAIVSLSAVLVLVFALHLYARFVLKRQARRRAAAIRQLSLTVAHARYTTEPLNTGLDPSIVAALPTFKRKQQKEENSHPHVISIVECAVCLSVLEDEEIVRLLPNCKHTFHVACIDTWLASHSTCPVCRTKVEPVRLEPESREGPHGHGAPSAPPVLLFEVEPPAEGTSEGGVASNISGSPKNNSRLSSFRRILSRERSSKRIQPSFNCDDDIDHHDLERQ